MAVDGAVMERCYVCELPLRAGQRVTVVGLVDKLGGDAGGFVLHEWCMAEVIASAPELSAVPHLDLDELRRHAS